jgi:serine phosphatase RsbU (regulator of sigma subunit)
MISGADVMSDVIEALRLGAWDYIVKPITNMAVLEHAVCKALERGRLVKENQIYRAQLEEKNMHLTKSLAQLKEDQDAGRSAQQKLLPKSNFQFGSYTISYKWLASLYLSGDFVDYFAIDQEKLGFYIADVSGHGASSAFVTVILKSLVSRLLADYQMQRDDNILHPEKVLKIINDDILNSQLGKYITMVYCVLDAKENILHYSVGGHYPSPVLWDGKKANFLPGGGFAVGILKEAKYESYQYSLPSEFTLAMFSDGVFEIMKGKNFQENENRLLNLIHNNNEKIENILMQAGITTELINTEGGLPDDLTLLLIQRKNNG